jgi:5-methylthioadenosine/S-adenosylhomocysteine deaminase
MNSAYVIHAQYVVPVRPERTMFENYAVVVEQGRIAAVLPSDEAKATYRHLESINLAHHVLFPGLINMHTHSPMTLLRGFADDIELQLWLENHIWPVEERFVSKEFVADGTRLAIAEMLRSGTSTFNELYFFPDVIADIAEETGVRASIGLPIFEMPTAWAKDSNEYFEKALGLLDARPDSDHVTFTLAPHAPYTVSNDSLTRIQTLSAERDLLVHMHLLEAKAELQQSQSQYGVSPLQRLNELELLNSRLLAVHMTQLSSADIQLLARKEVQVVHCPKSNLKLASGLCPVSELLDEGVNVSIGTDGAASNNNLDLLSEAQTAALLAKGITGDPTTVDAFSALEMITINGAKALGQEEKIGSIEIGKQADLAALDLNAPESQPVFNVISQLIYAVSSRQVSDVWVAGRHLLGKGELLTIDLDEVLAKAVSWRGNISAVKSQ